MSEGERPRTKYLGGRAHQVLSFVCSYKERYHISPSIREIGYGCGISSTSVVSYWLDRLESLGYMRRSVNVARSIVLKGKALELMEMMKNETIHNGLYTPSFLYNSQSC